MPDKTPYSHIIWDWNGTLYNDVEWCISVMNKMLSKRELKQLSGVAEYHKVFCFPVKRYYQAIGFDFDKEPFEILANEYVSLYHRRQNNPCKLHDNAETVLNKIFKKKIVQIILSASEINGLSAQMNGYDINKYFDDILGLTDIYAKSKIELGSEYIKRKSVKNALLIGDTEHDFETAKAIGADCVLIANGHQSKEQLLSLNVPVLDDIANVVEHIGLI